MNTIIPWLAHLNVLMPPGHIALVGAGNGKGVWVQWLVHQASMPRATLIEADPLQFATLQRTLNSFGERAQYCEIRNTLVASQPGTTFFFVASNHQESGLLEPHSLLGLWPNLQTEEAKELSAITLDTLLGDPGEGAEPSMSERHWLVVDCLPAGELLQASSRLDLVDVVIARVLLGELQSIPAGASLGEVSELLQRNGMVQIAVEATRHPGIGYALFVRDARSALHAQVQTHHSERQKLRLNGEEQAKLLQEFQAQIERLTQAKLIVETESQERVQQLEQLGKVRDEQAKRVQEHQAQIEQLTQTKAAADKHLQKRTQQLEQVGKARDEQTKLAQDRLAQIEQLTQAKAAADKQSQERAQQLEQLGKARDEQAKLVHECHVQIEQLVQAKAVAEKQSQERAQQMEQLGKTLNEQAKLADERLAQIEQLTQAKSAAEEHVQERAQQLEQANRALEEQVKLLQEHQTQISQLTQAKAVAEKQTQERMQLLEQAGKTHEEQVKQLTYVNVVAEVQAQELMRLGEARDQQAKLLLERQAQIEQLIKAKESAEQKIQELPQQIKNVQEQLRVEVEKNQDVQSLFKKQAEELVRLRKSLDTSLKKAITNASRQIQAFTGLENYWRTGELPTANNETHAWPVSPDFSLYVVTLLEKNDYDLVIEFGTGISTVVIAKALNKLSSKRVGKFPVGFISFDHLEQYYQQTLSMLQQAALGSYVKLHCTPLEDWVAPNGQSYPYYSCQKILEYIATQYSFSGLRILVIVDGPPGATSPHARYPAVPLILRYCTNANIDFLLDDYGRAPEKETVQFWEDDMKNENLKYHSTHLRLEKDACLISVINNKTDSNVN